MTEIKEAPKTEETTTEKAIRIAKEEKAYRALQERQKDIAGFQATLQKDYGKGALTPMSDHTLELIRISTGVLGVDLATGGGIPRGRITELFGPEESFKTSLCAGTIAMAQRTCVNCAMFGKFAIKGMVKIKMLDGSFREVPNHVLVDCPCGNPLQFVAAHFDMEGAFDPGWFEARGVWLEHCYLSRPVTLEESIDIGQMVLESGKFNLMTYDSIASATSEKEVEASASDALVGVGARAWNGAWRRWVLMQNKQYRDAYDRGDALAAAKVPTMIVINQVRMKIGVMFGSPETTPGGGGGKFSASLRIRMQGGAVGDEDGKTKSQKKKEEDNGGSGAGSGSELATHAMSFRVVKSKVWPKGGAGEFLVCQEDTSFHKMGEIDQDTDLVKFGLQSNVIEGSPNNYLIKGVYEDVRNISKRDMEKNQGELPLRRFRGKSEMEAFFAENQNEARRVYYEIVKSMTDVTFDGSMLPPKATTVEESEGD